MTARKYEYRVVRTSMVVGQNEYVMNKYAKAGWEVVTMCLHPAVDKWEVVLKRRCTK